jgi:hypothetical protein
MEKSSMFLEIFGSDSPIAPSAPVPRALPVVDDPLDAFTSPGHSADAEIQRLQDDAWGGEVCGLAPTEFRRVVTATAPAVDNFAKSASAHRRIEELNAKLEALISSEVSAALIPFRVEQIVETRRADLAKRAPMRKAAFNRMLSPLRDLVRAKNPWDASNHVEALEHQRWNNYDDQRFESLTTAMENFVRNAIINEA